LMSGVRYTETVSLAMVPDKVAWLTEASGYGVTPTLSRNIDPTGYFVMV
jgi:hypothetical protein